jgi:DNA polymerase-3 subunit epsilon
MTRNNKFAWFVLASIAFSLIVVSSFALMFWQQLTADQKHLVFELARENISYLFSAGVLLFVGLGFGLDWVFRLYVLPVDKLSEETSLIHSVNPSHRIQPDGGPDIIRLAGEINKMADHFETLHAEMQDKIRLALATAEEEKNILAAIMAESPEGVLICNKEGQIILYNRRAKQFLAADSRNGSSQSISGRFIGLGRSIFGLIDKSLVVHALEEIAEKLTRDETDVVSYFVVAGKNDRLIKVEAVPILDRRREFTGFILILYDITQQLKADSRVDLLLQSFVTGTRTAIASIRSSIEAILDYPAMGPERQQQFNQIIHQESLAVGKLIADTSAEYASLIHTRWPLVQMNCEAFLEAVRRKAGEKLGIDLEVVQPGDIHQLQVDSYSLTMAVLFLLSKLKKRTESREFSCHVEKQGSFVHLNFVWPGNPIKMETLHRWESQAISVEGEGLPSTLREVISHHGAEIWSHSREDGKHAYLCLLLPAVAASAARSLRRLTILQESRPEFFDFDLFNQPGQKPELDDRPLPDLAYTVFDTETTGLNPGAGDEIISIGAVRIVNGRLLHNEFFDQLIDPRRPVPWESVRIHGIHPDMLAGQPAIDEVLPAFHRFAEDTILVAHNAAFDMRMLQIKEAATGIAFVNPVLDILLLSAVAHPGQKSHNLESIAERLGVSIVGRHTALGDAIATAEVFLKLMPLLANLGITTLGQARDASRKTYHARLKY